MYVGNRLTEVRYPAAYGKTGNPRRRVSVKYDEASRLQELQVDSVVQMDQIAYNDYGQTTSIRIGGSGASSLTESYEYNADNGLLTRQKVKRGTTFLMDMSYGYARDLWSKGTLNGVAGHLTRVTNNLDRNKDRLYAYDALGRLFVANGGKEVRGGTEKISGVTAGWSQGYWYENNNRLSRDSSGVTADGKDVPFKGRTSWRYDDRTNRIITANHEYDNSGNMVRGRGVGRSGAEVRV